MTIPLMTPRARFSALRQDHSALQLYSALAVLRLLLVGSFLYFYFLPQPLLLVIIPTSVLGLLLRKITRTALIIEMVAGLIAIGIAGLGTLLSDSGPAAADAWLFLLVTAGTWAALSLWEIRLYSRVLSVASRERN